MVRSVLICLLAASTAVHAADLKTKLQRLFDQACHSQKFMGTVALSVSNKPVFSAACGSAEIEWHVKNTVDTRFRIAW